MDTIFQSHFIWRDFFIIAFILLLLYGVIFLFKEIVRNFLSLGNFQLRLNRWLGRMVLVYELIALLVLVSVFIGVNPVLHGIIILFLLAGSFVHLKSYISGVWIRFEQNIRQGQELQTGSLKGTVARMDRTQLLLQTDQGLHHLGYDFLLKNGYTLLSGDTIGGFYHLNLTPKSDVKGVKNHRNRLLDLMLTAPYIDWRHKPELTLTDEEPQSVTARFLLKEDQQLQELLALIKEWGYEYKVV